MKTKYTILNVIIFLFSLFNLQQYAQTNYSLLFDGIDDYARTTQVASVSNNFTIELWAKPLREINSREEGVINPPDNPPFINFAIHATHGDYNWGAGHTGVGIEIGTNGVNVFEQAHIITSSNLVWISPGSINGWTHIAVVYENKQPRLYINGTLVRTGVTSTKDYVHPGLGYDGHPEKQNSGFGNCNGNENFLGYLDEIRISDIVRYTSDFSPLIEYVNDVNTIGLFHFDEGSGITAADASSSNNDGTINGATWSTDVPTSQTTTNYSLSFPIPGFNISIPFDNSLNSYSGTQQFCVSMWIKPTGEAAWGYQHFVLKATGSCNDDFAISYNNLNDYSLDFNNARLCNPDQWWTFGANVLAINEWNHLELNFDGNIGKAWAFINGQKVGEQDGFLPASASSANVRFMNNIEGLIDEIHFSNIIRHNFNLPSFIPSLEENADTNSIGLWKLNEGSGDQVYDVSLNNNHGTFSGATWSTDVPTNTNYSLQFDGSTYVSIPHSSSLDLGSQFTIECWFTLQGTHSNDWIGIISKTEASHATASGYKLGLQEPFTVTYPNEINFTLYNYPVGSGVSSSFNPVLDSWYHLASTYDGSIMRLFLNGNLVQETAIAATILNNTLPLTIGGQNGNFWDRNLNGKIDEVRISSNVRYTSSFTPSTNFENDSYTEALYHFNEGSGSSVADESGNGNTGTIYGATWSTDVPDVAFPVELTSFTGHSENSNVKLSWATATELNNYGFELERKLNTENSDWEKIGFVEGAGTCNSPNKYSYRDKEAFGASKFIYRLKQLDTDGGFEYSDEVEVEIVPSKYELYQNYPNPFNPETTIRFSLIEPQRVSIKLYNVVGQEVTELVKKDFELGYHEVDFDASYLASGVYIFRIVAGNFVDVKKMILLK